MKPYYCPHCRSLAGYVNDAGDLHSDDGRKIAASDKSTTVTCPVCGYIRTWGKAPPQTKKNKSTGTKRYHTRLTMDDAREIRSRFYQEIASLDKLTIRPQYGQIKQLAALYSVSESAIRDVVQFKSWREDTEIEQ